MGYWCDKCGALVTNMDWLHFCSEDRKQDYIKQLTAELAAARQSRRRILAAWRQRREREQEAINEWADGELEAYDKLKTAVESRRRAVAAYRQWKRMARHAGKFIQANVPDYQNKWIDLDD